MRRTKPFVSPIHSSVRAVGMFPPWDMRSFCRDLWYSVPPARSASKGIPGRHCKLGSKPIFYWRNPPLRDTLEEEGRRLVPLFSTLEEHRWPQRFVGSFRLLSV